MASPWATINCEQQTLSLEEIMSEEIAKELQAKEYCSFAQQYSKSNIVESAAVEKQDPSQILQNVTELNSEVAEFCDSDAVIAEMLQYQFDKEHDEELKRVENKQNGLSKVSISYANHRKVPEELLSDSDDEHEIDGYDYEKKDWDRFDSIEKEFSTIPRCGYKIQEGKIVTKHDMTLSGSRNACKIMALPPEVHTGDAGGFDMQLSNKVFNSLQAYSNQGKTKKHKMHDRKESQATAEMGVDEKTRLLLYKMINSQLLKSVNGVVSTGKEAVILHAYTDPSYTECVLPKECALKVFKTTLNEFKSRDKYIKHDYRFKARFSYQNPRKIIHLWAEKEMHNLMRMQNVGLNVPDVIGLKKHILAMSFIGDNHKPAPKLKDAILTAAEWIIAYEEIIDMMCKMYNEARLIHADLSEYNILWHDDKCWFIDVSQSVEPGHPSALEFLMRDCGNISYFFTKKGVPDVKSEKEIFSKITGLNPNEHNTAMLERMHVKGPPAHMVYRPDTGPDESKPLVYPFDYAWEKSMQERRLESTKDDVKTEIIQIDDALIS